MAVNPYFNHYTDYREQNLIEDLIVECIQFWGMDMIFLPRKYRKLDLIYGEDVISKFEKSYDLEMYIKNVDGMTGDRDFLSKFGLELREQATFTVAQKRFNEVVDVDERIRPNEGDLIYLPLNNTLFEIKFVQPKSVFFQLGNLYVYDLQVEMYNFSHEEIKTDIIEVDNIGLRYAHTISMELDAGLGVFEVGETVFQGSDLTTATAAAEVVFFDQASNTLLLTKITGSFSETENIFGNTSGASWFIDSIDKLSNTNDPVDNTKPFKEESDVIIDFDEDNPFGEDL